MPENLKNIVLLNIFNQIEPLSKMQVKIESSSFSEKRRDWEIKEDENHELYLTCHEHLADCLKIKLYLSQITELFDMIWDKSIPPDQWHAYSSRYIWRKLFPL